jgi:hypothetical protein
MTEERPSDSLGSPDESRGGPDVDAAVANAESGSQVDGVHTPSGQAEPGESRLEQMRDVDTSSNRSDEGDPTAAPTPPKPGPSPADIGSGGAQRIEGARISDRVVGGEPVPDGPPFDEADDASR